VGRARSARDALGSVPQRGCAPSGCARWVARGCGAARGRFALKRSLSRTRRCRRPRSRRRHRHPRRHAA